MDQNEIRDFFEMTVLVKLKTTKKSGLPCYHVSCQILSFTKVNCSLIVYLLASAVLV